MALIVTGSMRISFVPDGAGAMTVPQQQTIDIKAGAVPGTLGAASSVTVAGGDAPTQAQLQTAMIALGTAISNALTPAQVATILAWNASAGN